MKKYGYLKVRLKDEKITYVQLARELNITPSALSNKLNGKYDFWLSELKLILNFIGVANDTEKCKLLNI